MEISFFIAVFCLLASAPGTSSQPSVKLPDTDTVVTGAQHTVNGKSLDVYLSVPYAQPPTGVRRFKDPEPITSYPSQINASQFPPSCFQKLFFPNDHVNKEMSEDCLYLNIWTPSRKSKMGVLIYIFGGGFELGSTDQYINNPQYLAARTQMVVVTINYRLGSFGFLDLNMEGSYGNLGLRDQTLAFKWVKKNIKAFGGNPEHISLYGLSAGSMSIAFHLSIEENRGLFHRAFLQSGTSNSPFFNLLVSGKQRAIDKYYEVLSCNQNSPEVLPCLQNKTSEEIMEAEYEASTINSLSFFSPVGTFVPNFNGKLFPFTSILDFTKKNILLPIDIIIGITKDEVSATIPVTKSALSQKNATIADSVQYIQQILGQENSTEFAKIANSYLKDVREHDYDAYSLALKELVEDFIFGCPVFYFANIVASLNKQVYFYYFTYQTKYKADNESTRYLGASHGDDLQYVMGLPLRDSLPYTRQEYNFADRMMDYAGNFAKYGRPSLQWPRYLRGRDTPPYDNDCRPQPVAELHANHYFLRNFPIRHRCTGVWRPYFYPSSV